MRNLTDLGAALYVPSTRHDLVQIASGTKLEGVRAIIFCTEDAILQDEVPVALANLKLMLLSLRAPSLRRLFIRVRSPAVLQAVLDMDGVEHVEGFVLPKVTRTNLREYWKLLKRTDHSVMPILETREAFDQGEMNKLLRTFDRKEVRSRILLLRIGGNDLLSLIGLRRRRGATIYQTPIGHVIARLVTTFRPFGFKLSAPVFDYFDDIATLHREVEEDLAYGLTGKTAIHPSQVPLIEWHYRVGDDEMEMAQHILSNNVRAVFGIHGAMCEIATHRNWALGVVSAAEQHGRREPLLGRIRAVQQIWEAPERVARSSSRTD